jgi:hypothetical protein
VMRLTRIRLWMLTVLVAACACVCAGVALCRKSRSFHEEAMRYAKYERVMATRTASYQRFYSSELYWHDDRWRHDVQATVDASRRLGAHYKRLRLKYEHAARNPWLPVAPDPPTPQ